MMQTCQLTRGSLALKTGVNADTIRYYEKVGVMPDPPRTAGGHRVYDEPLVRRLLFIKRCRELGFALDELLNQHPLHLQGAQVVAGFTQFNTVDDPLQLQVFQQLYGGYPISFMEVAQGRTDVCIIV